jgi:hypothetical protein
MPPYVKDVSNIKRTNNTLGLNEESLAMLKFIPCDSSKLYENYRINITLGDRFLSLSAIQSKVDYLLFSSSQSVKGRNTRGELSQIIEIPDTSCLSSGMTVKISQKRTTTNLVILCSENEVSNMLVIPTYFE